MSSWLGLYTRKNNCSNTVGLTKEERQIDRWMGLVFSLVVVVVVICFVEWHFEMDVSFSLSLSLTHSIFSVRFTHARHSKANSNSSL